MRNILTILLIFISGHAFADAYTGYIQKIDIHSNHWSTYNEADIGLISLYIEGMPVGCNLPNGSNRVVMTTSHPLYQSVLSVALAAKMSGKKVTVNYLNTCTLRSNAWDFGYISLRE